MNSKYVLTYPIYINYIYIYPFYFVMVRNSNMKENKTFRKVNFVKKEECYLIVYFLFNYKLLFESRRTAFYKTLLWCVVVLYLPFFKAAQQSSNSMIF